MLRPASEMKDSGIEWVGNVPSDWNVVPVRSCFNEVVEKNKDGMVKNALKFTYGKIVPKTNFDADEDDYVADTILNYYVVSPGTIMINGLNLNFDFISQRTALVREKGIITSAYVGIVPKNYSVTLPEFMNYLFKAYDYRMAFHNMGGGVRKILNFTRLKSQRVCFPGIAEQKAIADYLDDRCSKIDEIIAEATASVEEYKELKQAVLFEAVTKGLDKNVPMKDSGVKWQGKIPSAWRIVRLKYLLTYLIDCPHETPDYSTDGNYYVIRTADQELGFLRPDENMYRLNESEYINRIKRLALEKDDIVYGREGERWGLACIVPESKKYCLGQRMLHFRCNTEKIVPRFLMWALNSNGVRMQGVLDTMGSTSPHVNISTVRNFSIPTPDIQSQIAIVDYLDDRISDIDVLISEKQALIEDLKAYKKSLIYEVVTGKRRIV